MNKTLLVLASTLAIAALPQMALAQTAAPAAPAAAPAEPEASPLSFNVSLTSDYRYRGISQSRLKPAIQGGVDYALPAGFYIGAWASSIKWIKDGGGDGSVEIDLYGGYKGEIAKDFTYDVGVLTYQYPRNHLATSANTTEIYGALTYGPATLKYSHSVSNLFGFVDSKNSGYIDLSATFEVGPAIQLIPHVGHQRVAGSGNSDFSYTDYSFTVGKDFSGFFLSAAVVGTDAKKIGGVPVYSYNSGEKDLGKTGLVIAVKKTF
ncbi:MAG: TorF family putative porin [Burkholderiales bacterium]